MNTHRSNPAERINPASTTPINSSTSPGVPAGLTGSAGNLGGTLEQVSEKSAHPHPSLPGFEDYFPPLPIELDISSKPLTETIGPLLDKWEKERAVNVGACINIFPSGEITGGFYNTGRKAPPERKGKTISQEFTRKAKKTIRRAVESGIADFKVFVTLTFDPKIAQLDDSGQVNQAWAKKEFKRFLNTIKKFYDRKGGADE
jgi:hypothetical protein